MEQSQKSQHDLNLLEVSKGNNAPRYDESERDRILDFIIYEKTFNNNSGLDIYLKNNIVTDSKELKLISAMKTANTAMYEVLESNEEQSTVKLKDIDTNEIRDKVSKIWR